MKMHTTIIYQSMNDTISRDVSSINPKGLRVVTHRSLSREIFTLLKYSTLNSPDIFSEFITSRTAMRFRYISYLFSKQSRITFLIIDLRWNKRNHRSERIKKTKYGHGRKEILFRKLYTSIVVGTRNFNLASSSILTEYRQLAKRRRGIAREAKQ